MTSSSRVDQSLSPFVGSREDFAAYLHEIDPCERAAFVAKLPSVPSELAKSLFPLEFPQAAVPPPCRTMPDGGWRFRVRNDVGGETLYICNKQPHIEGARTVATVTATKWWERFGIRCAGVTVTLVDERWLRLVP
jgi:hypothetical protein